MWFPVLGVVCVGLFIGAAVAQFKQHQQQQSDDSDLPPPHADTDPENTDDPEPE